MYTVYANFIEYSAGGSIILGLTLEVTWVPTGQPCLIGDKHNFVSNIIFYVMSFYEFVTYLGTDYRRKLK